MDLIFLLVLPSVLFVQAWYLLGFYSNPRALGMVAAGAAIILLAVVLFQDKLQLVVGIGAPGDLLISPATAISAFALVWAGYSAFVAGVYLWGLETRSLGFFSLFVGVISGVLAAYFFVGDALLDGVVIQFTWLMGVVAVLLAILAGLLFFYLALRPSGQGEPPSSTMRAVTGWFYLVFSVAIGVLGSLLLLGLDPLL